MPLPPINPKRPAAFTHDGRIASRLAALEREVRGLKNWLSGGTTQQVPVVTLASFPAGRLGRVVMNRTDGKVYRDNGSAWQLVG